MLLEPKDKVLNCLVVFDVILWQVGRTLVNEDCTFVSTCVHDGGEPIMNMLTSNHVEVTNYHTVYLFFVVFL